MGFARYDLPLSLRTNIVRWTAAKNCFKAPTIRQRHHHHEKYVTEKVLQKISETNAILSMSYGALENN